jgi:hypothetical protein
LTAQVVARLPLTRPETMTRRGFHCKPRENAAAPVGKTMPNCGKRRRIHA